MSAIPSYTVLCDGCSEVGGSMDLGCPTAARARAEAVRDGWRVGQIGGKDFCAACVADGTAAAQTKRETAKRVAMMRRKR